MEDLKVARQLKKRYLTVARQLGGCGACQGAGRKPRGRPRKGAGVTGDYNIGGVSTGGRAGRRRHGGAHTGGKRPPSEYNIFVKDFIAANPQIDPRMRFAAAAKAWHSMR